MFTWNICFMSWCNFVFQRVCCLFLSATRENSIYHHNQVRPVFLEGDQWQVKIAYWKPRIADEEKQFSDVNWVSHQAKKRKCWNKNKTQRSFYPRPLLAVLSRSPTQTPNWTMRFFLSLTAPLTQLFLVYWLIAVGGELPCSQEAGCFLVYHGDVRFPQHLGISSCWLVQVPTLESGSINELFLLQGLFWRMIKKKKEKIEINKPTHGIFS